MSDIDFCHAQMRDAGKAIDRELPAGQNPQAQTRMFVWHGSGGTDNMKTNPMYLDVRKRLKPEII